MFNLYSWINKNFTFLLISNNQCAVNGVKKLSCKKVEVWEHSGLGSKDLE